MLATLARGSYLLFIAAMLVAWALSLGKGVSSQPGDGYAIERLYS